MAFMSLEPPNDPGTGGVAHEAIKDVKSNLLTCGYRASDNRRSVAQRTPVHGQGVREPKLEAKSL